jgi:ribonuclease HI
MVLTQAELWVLVQALQYAKAKWVNIYTDCKHAFATLHVHGAIYKERGLLTAGGKEIKNKEEILQLLEAVWEPSQVAIMHCRGHQKGTYYESRGNHLADQVAIRAAEELKCRSKLPNFCWLWSCLPS